MNQTPPWLEPAPPELPRPCITTWTDPSHSETKLILHRHYTLTMDDKGRIVYVPNAPGSYAPPEEIIQFNPTTSTIPPSYWYSAERTKPPTRRRLFWTKLRYFDFPTLSYKTGIGAITRRLDNLHLHPNPALPSPSLQLPDVIPSRTSPRDSTH